MRVDFRQSRGPAVKIISLGIGLIVAGLVPFGMSQSAAPNLKDRGLITAGEKVFVARCSVAYCHGKEGTTGRAPALRDRAWKVNELHETILKGIPNSVMPSWEDKISAQEIWAVTGYILSISEGATSSGSPFPAPTAGSTVSSPLASSAETMPSALVGDPKRGEELFFESSRERGCSGCHTVDGKGNAVGPDLSGSTQRSPRALFESVILPAARDNGTYQQIRVTMKDGEKIEGIKNEESATAIRISDTSVKPPVMRRLAKDQIQGIESVAGSAMPSRFGEIYTVKELLDLVSFMKSSGASGPMKVTFADIR